MSEFLTIPNYYRQSSSLTKSSNDHPSGDSEQAHYSSVPTSSTESSVIQKYCGGSETFEMEVGTDAILSSDSRFVAAHQSTTNERRDSSSSDSSSEASTSGTRCRHRVVAYVRLLCDFVGLSLQI